MAQDTRSQTVDVVIAGAGLSGLTAAHQLVQRGRSVVVLEAGERVGGRTLDLAVADGVVTEGGGQWIGLKHTRMLTLLGDLPTRRAALQRIWHNGTETKVFAVYDTPFWRDRGLNGSALTDLPVAHYVVDNSPPDGSVGILLTFVGTAASGPGSTWSDDVLDVEATRHAALVSDLVTLFGPQAAKPRKVIEQSWVHEPWISGCVSTRVPGVMTQYTDAVTKPVDRVHWAGTEAAPEFEGYLEGAVRAADRAVSEVLDLI